MHCELDAVDGSHDHVGDDYIGLLVAAPGHSLLCAVDGEGVVAAHSQNGCEGVGDEYLVVDHQHSKCRESGDMERVTF